MSFKTAMSLRSNTGLKLFFVLAATVVVFVLSLLGEKETKNICFKNNCFIVEVASKPKDWERGLSFRLWLGKDKGMLFNFQKEGKYFFWMKNTFIPLDIVWLDQNLKAVFIKKSAPPCLFGNCEIFSSPAEATYVLEIKSGEAEKIGLELDSQLEFR